ncbi:hypothetical protein DVH05_007461 [Phytophthora capsici]|nr:hypothetical protein DVH05_007461 [Phytophthora capsici]
MTAITQEIEDFLASCDLTTPLILIDGEDITDSRLNDFVAAPRRQQRRRKKLTGVDYAVKQEMDRIKDRKRCSNYRQRQRNERERLQQEEKLLMAKLAAIQKARKEKALSSTSVWKLFAQNQLEARLNAETKQRRLCQAIEARGAYIREFHELSQRRIAIDDGLTLNDLQTDSDVPFCQLYVQNLDGIHAQTDACLNTFGELPPVKKWEEKNAGCFQFVERQELLCDFEQACQMLWDAVQLRNRQECRMDFHHVPDPNTASAFNFRTSSRLSSGQVVSALQRVVTCRYRTRDRQVFVWQSYMDGEGMFTGLRAGETGWDILTRSVDASGLEKVTRTTVIWHTPMHVGNATIPESIMKEFTAMTIDSVSEDGNEIAKEFEKIRIAV